MATYFLITSVVLAGSRFRAGQLLDDVRDPITQIQNAGGLTASSSDPYVRGAATLAAQLAKKGAADEVLDRLMMSAVLMSLMAATSGEVTLAALADQTVGNAGAKLIGTSKGGGGTVEAVLGATVTTANAALPAADKRVSPIFNKGAHVQTTDAAAHTILTYDIATDGLPTDCVIDVELRVKAHRTSDHTTSCRRLSASFRMDSSVLTQVSTPTEGDSHDDVGAAAWVVTIDATANQVRVQVQDPGASTVDWRADGQFDVYAI